MESESFHAEFAELMGFPPMGWQTRLYDQWLAQGRLPTSVDVPTGLGKTAVMVLWLIARRHHADLPRRLVYVVDRRAVVDQASLLAEHLASKTNGLVVSTLRGQHPDNRRWQEDPTAPAIIVGTVDMIGSRLLFEGYGVSRGMRPFHAGLLGADTLFLLDEAHLSLAFQALLRSASAHHNTNRQAPVPGSFVIPLSATPAGAGIGQDHAPFRFEPADADPKSQPVAHQRFHSTKRLTLTTLSEKSKLADSLCERARALPPGRIVVFCHSREVAQSAAEKLRKSKAGAVKLFTGASRAREREDVVPWLEHHRFVGTVEKCAEPAPRAFLVATSAGEVGVDFDADHMVCDLVAFERMSQRLGRVNRRGGIGREAKIEVLAVTSDGSEERARALQSLPQAADGSYDACPAALAELRTREPATVAAASTPPVPYPPLEPAQVEAWSLTALRDHPGRPAPEPWLRGWVDPSEAEVEIIWRKWLPWRPGQPCLEAEVNDFFELAPPHPLEKLRIQASAAERWLAARARAWPGNDANLPAVILLNSANEFMEGLTAATVLELSGAKKIRNRLIGNTLVVSSSLGGLTDGLLDPKGASEPACWDDGWSQEEIAKIGAGLFTPQGLPGEHWRVVGDFAWDESGDSRRVIAALRSSDSRREGTTAVSRHSQSLADHTAWVVSEIERIATVLALPAPLRQVLILVAQVHDRGKQRILWQDAMGAPPLGRPYAKTRAGCNPARLRIGDLTYRHEFGSLAAAEVAAETDSAWLALPPDLRDLALHLIASHHGFARPAIAPADPDVPPSSPELLARSTRAAIRFARLQERWGAWGLAWWEALFRAADQRASRRLDAMPTSAAVARGGGA